VALKLLLGGTHADAERRARFLAEADAFARLRHHNIVQIHQVGEHDGLLYLALEYVEGGTLAGRLGGVPMAPDRAADLIAQLARAVDFAHLAGVVHRDLKPSNVLMAGDGTPKVTDFGLAKQEQSELTATGAILGTPSYMSPEQARGQAREVGPEADVYALGALLYELVTGRPPFRGATPLETLEQVRGTEPVPPSRLVPRLPRDLETICLKCLRKEPARRYPAASALAEDLRRFRAGEPILARRTGGAERAWRLCRRNPAVATLLVSVGSLIVAIAVLSSVSAARLGVEARRAQGAERDALERLFHASFARAKTSRGSGRMGQRYDTLQALAEAAALRGRVGVSNQDILDMRAEAIAAMALPDIRLGLRWAGNPDGTIGRAFDSTYERYALLRKDGEVTIRRIADDRVLRRLVAVSIDGLNRQALLRFSPDDRYLAAYFQESDSGCAFLWDLDRSEDHPLLILSGCSSPWSFAGSGRMAVIGTRDRRVRRFDLGTGREREPLDAGLVPSAVAVQPQGRVLAVAALERGVVRLIDPESGRLLDTLSHAPADGRPDLHRFDGIAGLAWHPDGELLAAACHDHKIYVWDWLAGRQRSVLVGHSWEVAEVAFSHSGDLLASYSHDKTVRLWDHRAGTLLLTIPQAKRWVGFSRDDRTFTAQGEGTHLALCHLDMPAEFRLFEGHHRRRDDICGVQFHPGGRLLVTAAESDGVRLWDAATSRQLAHLSVAPTDDVLFEKGGTGLLTFNSGELRRWSLKISAVGDRERIQIDPPRRLLALDHVYPFGHIAFCGPDQKRLLVADYRRRVSLIELAPRPRVGWTWPTPTACFVASSPDGRWVAAGSFFGAGLHVWDTLRNEEAFRSDGESVDIAFHPGGRWFVASYGGGSYAGAECRFFRLPTWEPGPSVALDRTTSSSPIAFSDDGRMLAVNRTMTELAVLDPRDLRELARLQSREPTILSHQRFSPDGGQLVAGTAAGYLHVWDLRRIRARLAEMDLDWDLPAFRPAPEDVTAAPIEVDLRLDADSLIVRANYHLEIRSYHRAVVDFEEALARDFDRREVRRALIGILTNGPVAVRDPGRAEGLMRAALDRGAGDPAARGDLGMIRHRQGRHAEAVESLEQAIREHQDPVDRARWRIVLAMSQHHLGRTQAARESRDLARSESLDAKFSPAGADEWARLRFEADSTLSEGHRTP
jgi:WD40 repeat protein